MRWRSNKGENTNPEMASDPVAELEIVPVPLFFIVIFGQAVFQHIENTPAQIHMYSCFDQMDQW